MKDDKISKFLCKLGDFSYKMAKERVFWAEHDGFLEGERRKKAGYGLHTK